MKNQVSRVIYGNSDAKAARVVGLLGWLLVVLLIPAPPLLGQTGQGTLTGTVTDASRGIVPGATVTLTNVDTGVSVKTESSEAGIYYFGAVPIGHYRVAVLKQGFKEWEGTFTLEVGQNAVVDPVLQVGSTATVVEVTGAAVPIEVTNGAVADVKESNQIRDLPLDGRQVGQLFNLTAGVESGSGGARVNGMKVGSLDINMDGVTMVDRFGGGMVRVQPGIETIQEFRIETVGSEARFDQPATVIMASRSGTNSLHGGGYEYIRDNTVLGATRLRTDPIGSGFVLPELIRNEFGVYLGGPIYIPHLYNGKNKSFWFFDYEGLRDRERQGVLQPWVPTAAMWGGDLSNAVDVNNPCAVSSNCPQGYTPNIIYDPKSTNPTTFERTPFTNNQIPGPYSPTAVALKGLTELPCCGSFATNNPYIAPNVTNTYPYIQTLNNYTAKWDENISDKDRLSVRYTRGVTTAAQEGGYYANPLNPTSGMGSSADNYYNTNVGVNYNRTISPNWLNELLIGVLRDPNHYGTLADFTDWSARLGTPNPFGVTGWPTLYTEEASLGSAAYFGWDSDNNHLQHLTSETIEDNVTWTRGKHTVQFGFRGRKEQNDVAELQQAQGSHNWGPSYTTDWSPSAFNAAPDTGSGFAELLLGLPNYLSNQYNRGYFYFRQTEIGTYFSDKIKVSPRLTLSLGLRWDKWTPYTEARNRLTVPYDPESTFEVITPGNVNMNSLGTPPAVLTSWSNLGLKYATASSVGYPSDLFRPINHDFAPRLGIAYQIKHNTVIRGSYGIYYVAMPLSLILQSTRSNPPLTLRFQNNPYVNPSVPGGVNGPYFNLYPLIVAPAPADYMPPATVDITKPQNTLQLYGNGATYWDGPNWNDERQQTWNITVEHELPGHIGTRLSYIGTYGGNLEQQYGVDDQEPYYNYAVRTGLQPPSNSYLLRPVPEWSLIGLNHTGYSRDHSLQAEVHRTFANGIGFQAFYTFVRALTTTDPGGFSDGNTSVNGGAGTGGLGGSGGATVPENVELLGEPQLSYQQRLKLTYFNNTTIPPHRFTFDGIYDLPFGKGKHFGGQVPKSLNYLIGGWQLATIGTWNSGPWMGVSTSLVQTGNVRISSGQRATFNIPGSSFRYRQWFSGNFNTNNATNVSGTPVSATVRPAGPNCSGAYSGQLAVTLANGTCYNAPFSGFYNPNPRDNIIGPGAWNDDLSLYKHFKIGERFDMRFSADAFNAFNHPNDVAPSTSTGLQNLGQQANSSRVIQLSMRVEF